MSSPLFAVAQMNSQNIIAHNLATVETFMKDAALSGVSLLVLPENFACFAAGQQQKTAAQFDAIQAQLQQLAARYQLWLVAGSLPCPYRPNGQRIADGRVRATSLLISPEAKTIARYDKIHLFDAQLNDATGRYQESATYEPGNQVVSAQTPFGTIGMMVCYDLRFPELALTLRKQGADYLTAPAAFTTATGHLHWQLLLRARAIDTQCYVLGSGQQGTHGQRSTWGHSAIISPLGEVLAEHTQDGQALLSTPIDKQLLADTRHNIPLMAHRRLTTFTN